MRVTNAMMVTTSKININTNKINVDTLNRKMSNQKKIVKPSDDPIIAIRALRLRATLSSIDQYYERNIPDCESWMEVTETAMVNMKDILTSANEQVVYGATDELNQDNRNTILKELQALQEQIYNEGNADFEGRTVFTGYKTNQQLTFTSAEEADEASYEITERFGYQDIESYKYYTGTFQDTSIDTLMADDVTLPEEHTINRIRLAYDKIYDETVGDDNTSFSISFQDGDTDISMGFGGDNTSISFMGCTFELEEVAGTGLQIKNPDAADLPEGITISSLSATVTSILKDGVEIGRVAVDGATLGDAEWTLSLPDANGNPVPITYTTSTTDELEANNYEGLGSDGEEGYKVVLNKDTGELLLSDSMAEYIESTRAQVSISYSKTGFDKGELRPENYFDCVNKTDPSHPLTYNNYDENGDWITEGIYYNIANKQEMKINTEARDVFDAGIRRDMDELIDIVQDAISAQTVVDEIEAKLESGVYEEDSDEYQKLEDWLDAANKQLDYANQNMHDTYSAYITKFQGYLSKVTLAITDSGSRGERVALTKNRMNNQQTVFEELKSVNEDADLSELVIDYSAAQVSYQAALQAAAKIGKMTLLDFI